jgi:hypothetical protein
MNFSDQIISYYSQIQAPEGLPEDVITLNPYKETTTLQYASKFYQKYYNDSNERVILFGINPGRFGAGVTGVPFTDPIKLQENCEIPNELEKRAELSSNFIYEMIDAFGGANAFYAKYFISAVSPLGYVRNNINLNYYDIKGYKKLFETYCVNELKKQLKMPISTKKAFSIGKGKNIEFLSWINQKYGFFDEIIPLPHPRWVMQYRLKRKLEFIEEYVSKLD